MMDDTIARRLLVIYMHRLAVDHTLKLLGTLYGETENTPPSELLIQSGTVRCWDDFETRDLEAYQEHLERWRDSTHATYWYNQFSKDWVDGIVKMDAEPKQMAYLHCLVGTESDDVEIPELTFYHSILQHECVSPVIVLVCPTLSAYTAFVGGRRPLNVQNATVYVAYMHDPHRHLEEIISK